jgi:hypothetical protein
MPYSLLLILLLFLFLFFAKAEEDISETKLSKP